MLLCEFVCGRGFCAHVQSPGSGLSGARGVTLGGAARLFPKAAAPCPIPSSCRSHEKNNITWGEGDGHSSRKRRSQSPTARHRRRHGQRGAGAGVQRGVRRAASAWARVSVGVNQPARWHWQCLLFSSPYLLNFASDDISYFRDQKNKVRREEEGDETSPGAEELSALLNARLLVFSGSHFRAGG